MNKIIASFLVGVFLLPASAFAQTVDAQEQHRALIYQLIALLTEQLHALQAQVAEQKASIDKMAYEELEKEEDAKPKFEIRKDGDGFEVWSNVKGSPERITVILEDGPTSLTLKAGLTKKGAYLTDGMRKNGKKYTIDLTDRLGERDGNFNGEFEILFPEDFASSTDYTVEYEDANYEKLTASLHKNATAKPERNNDDE